MHKWRFKERENWIYTLVYWLGLCGVRGFRGMVVCLLVCREQAYGVYGHLGVVVRRADG